MTVRIGLGISNFPFGEPKAYWRWVELCEKGDVDSLWQTDRLVSRQPFLESLSAMAGLAGATERIKFGMNAVVVPFRDPLVLAKQCATIDYLSQGRLLPVFGVGNERAPEFGATGRETKRRGRQANEALEIMSRLWSQETVSFEGEFYRYREVSIEPRPVQQPLPLWIGGASRAAVRRTARLGTGWLAGTQTPEQVAPTIAAIRRELEAVGRSIDEDHYGAGFVYRFGSWDDPILQRAASARRRLVPDFDPSRYFAVGSAEAILARCAEYRRAGVSKFVLIPLAEGPADFFAQTERLLAEVLPVIHT